MNLKEYLDGELVNIKIGKEITLSISKARCWDVTISFTHCQVFRDGGNFNINENSSMGSVISLLYSTCESIVINDLGEMRIGFKQINAYIIIPVEGVLSFVDLDQNSYINC